MNYKYILTVILIVAAFSGTASAAWANTSYTYAKDITLLGADTQLSNYPYLVSVAKEPGMQADYDDLIFYDQPVSQDGNLIDFEIETYNSTTATVWLNITTLPTAGKIISVYYGNPSASSTQNPTAVWDSDYVGVWHMSDNVTTDYAWNNYKQPNGVITADASTNYSILEPNVLYEDGMFKMWVHVDYEGATSLAYYTSVDGYNWTCVDPHIINESCWCPSIYKNETTGDYWLYNGNASTNKVDLYIGTNETNFEIDTWGCWSAADAGGSQIGNSCIWKENTSDWYMIFEYSGSGWNGKYATSSNGKDWTFHNQIIVSGFGSNGLSGPSVWKNGGTYYMLFHGNTGNDGGIPSTIYVATSTNRQDWTYRPGFEITREYDWEGVGQPDGQVGDPTIVEYNGETYIFYGARHSQTPNDAANPHRIGLVHLNESLGELANRIDAGGPKVTDSTSNHRDGAPTNIASSIDGALGGCMEFNGNSSRIDLGTPPALPSATHELWANASTITSDIQLAYAYNLMTGVAPISGIHFTESSGIDKIGASVGVNFDYVNASPLHYYNTVIISNASGNDVWYVNGAQVASKTHSTNYADDASRWAFGADRNLNCWYGGTLDEGRVSDIMRSADWINLSYQMVVNPSYVTFGAEETGGGGCGAYNITLPSGWSIIGWTNPTASTAHSMGGLIGGNCQYVTERNSTTGLYVTHVMSIPADDNFAIERGWGYFVRTTAETLWERDS